MQTHKYQFPASSDYISKENVEKFKEALEDSLRNGQDCLTSYAMFPSDSDILDHISFELNEKHEINAINLYTYTQLWDGAENDLRSCVQSNLYDLIEQKFGKYDIDICTEGSVQYLGSKENDKSEDDEFIKAVKTIPSSYNEYYEI